MQRHKAAAAPPRPPSREDCWSEGETSALVDAWGERFLELNRGNIPQKQWQEVADSVNTSPGSTCRPPRTGAQCKNRVDTLKKKYKIEKGKICEGVAVASDWAFYSRLDLLVGSSAAPLKKASPLGFPCFVRRKRRREGMRELALGIERLVEIYERVEGEKRREMMELEKQRMEFIKGVEFQRMRMFVDTQVQVERIKQAGRGDDGSYS